MKIKNIFFTLALIALSACTTAPQVYVESTRLPPPVTADGIVTCVNQQDEALDFKYHPNDVARWYSEDFDVYVYLIDTADGGQIALNSLELENYACSKPL